MVSHSKWLHDTGKAIGKLLSSFLRKLLDADMGNSKKCTKRKLSMEIINYG